MPIVSFTALDAEQIAKTVYDEASDAIKTTDMTAGVQLEEINNTLQSIEADQATAAFQIVQNGKLDTIANKINSVQLFTMAFDAITAEYPSSTQEIYKSRTGGTSGTVVQTIAINYTDATKNFISDVART